MNRKEYLFSLLSEEACEIAQAASKCLRFTPDHAFYEASNLARLQTEVIDMLTVLDMLSAELDRKFDTKISESKRQRILSYMDISKKLGTLTE